MKKAQAASVKGLRVRALYCEKQDEASLAQQFRRLGIEGSFADALPDPADAGRYDLVMFDSDHASLASHGEDLRWPDLPRIALIGAETPSRLLWTIRQGVSSHLRKPVRFEGVLSACLLARDAYRAQQAMRERVDELEQRLKSRRFVFSAQLMLMRERGLDEHQAFSALRTLAMQRQVSVERLSMELLAGRACDGPN